MSAILHHATASHLHRGGTQFVPATWGDFAAGALGGTLVALLAALVFKGRRP